MTPLPDAAFGVLLVDAETTALTAIIGRLRKDVGAVILGGGRSSTWSAGGACFPKTARPRIELRGADTPPADLSTR